MEQQLFYNANSHFHKVIQNGESPFPKNKSEIKTKVVVVLFTAAAIVISPKTHQSFDLMPLKTKTSILTASDTNGKKYMSLSLSKNEEVKTMSELKLNEFQKHFDDKISDTNNIVHEIDKKVFGIEKDINAIKNSILELKNEIPEIIEKSISETKDKKKEKFRDNISAPIITGVIAGIVVLVLQFFLKSL